MFYKFVYYHRTWIFNFAITISLKVDGGIVELSANLFIVIFLSALNSQFFDHKAFLNSIFNPSLSHNILQEKARKYARISVDLNCLKWYNC